MNDELLELYEIDGESFLREQGFLISKSYRVPIVDGVPCFVPSDNYSNGNFSRLRERHSTLQLDSVNGTRDRYDTILERTGWPPEYFKGKWVLECGCGAGPDTEILLKLGARVVAVDLYPQQAKKNIGVRDDVDFIQASIMNLPFRKKSFDIVFCHQVLQHTPDPQYTMRHMLEYVKDEGAVMIYTYAKTFWKLCNVKYLLRPFTTRIPPELLYYMIKAYSPFAYRLTQFLYGFPGGQYFCYSCIPFSNMSHIPQFKNYTDAQFIELGVHETFDELSPKYDIPTSKKDMETIGNALLKLPFDFMETKTKTILRTLVN